MASKYKLIIAKPVSSFVFCQMIKFKEREGLFKAFENKGMKIPDSKNIKKNISKSNYHKTKIGNFGHVVPKER